MKSLVFWQQVKTFFQDIVHRCFDWEPLAVLGVSAVPTSFLFSLPVLSTKAEAWARIAVKKSYAGLGCSAQFLRGWSWWGFCLDNCGLSYVVEFDTTRVTVGWLPSPKRKA